MKSSILIKFALTASLICNLVTAIVCYKYSDYKNSVKLQDAVMDPLDHYLKSGRTMNQYYVKNDIPGLEKESKVTDLYFNQCVENGQIVRFAITKEDEPEFLKILSNDNVKYFLSGSQNLGGQRASGTYGLEKSDLNTLMKNLENFRNIISRAH